MKYYLSELTLPPILNLKELYKETTTTKKILCKDGSYRITGNKLCNFSIDYINDSEIINYIGNHTLFASDYKEEINNKKYYIPYIHHIVQLEYHKYKLHPKSSTSFIIEKNENKIIDFYFESSLPPTHYSLKEDISSLVSYLK